MYIFFISRDKNFHYVKIYYTVDFVYYTVDLVLFHRKIFRFENLYIRKRENKLNLKKNSKIEFIGYISSKIIHRV